MRRTPEQVKAVKTDERRLAWGLATDGTVLVGTATALYAGDVTLAWTSVERVSWEPPLLRLLEVSSVEGTGAVRSWELTEDDRLAELVRARVTSSVGWSDRRRLPTGGHVRLVGRRSPDAEYLSWQGIWERAVDEQDPLLRAQVDVWVAELRKTIG